MLARGVGASRDEPLGPRLRVPLLSFGAQPMSLLLLFNKPPYHGELLRAAKRNLDAR